MSVVNRLIIPYCSASFVLRLSCHIRVQPTPGEGEGGVTAEKGLPHCIAEKIIDHSGEMDANC